MTIEEAFGTFDWATFHKCGHPVQRFNGDIAPCSYCWNRGTNVAYLPAPLPPMHVWTAEPLPTTVPKDIRLRLKSYVARDDGKRFTGRIWTLEE